MRHIIPAIVATVQILIGFFFFFTLVMISIHMVSPVIMPDERSP
jgi:phage shock protein PspC (stress-responsive transcriptional regulator)